MKKLKLLWFSILHLLRIKRRHKPLPGSTIMKVTGPGTDAMKQEISDTLLSDEQSIQKFMCEYIIPSAKVDALTTYISEQRRLFPKMKTGRILRKAAEYFRLEKIKFV